MELTARWPQLADLVDAAQRIGGMRLWAFGSMLVVPRPSDLDVAVLYWDRRRLVELRAWQPWELTHPPVDLIGLTPREDMELRFLEGVRGVRLSL